MAGSFGQFLVVQYIEVQPERRTYVKGTVARSHTMMEADEPYLLSIMSSSLQTADIWLTPDATGSEVPGDERWHP